MTMAEQLESLRERERRLVARRKALEARVNMDRERRTGRQTMAIGAALLAWMRADDMARKALPQRLKRFIDEKDRTVVEAAFRDVIEASEREFTMGERGVSNNAQS